MTWIQRLRKQNEYKIELFLRKCQQKFIWFAKSGLESRSGQGFSEPAVATVITASGIVTLPQSAIPDNAWPLQQRKLRAVSKVKIRRNDFP